ncbi:ATPase family associated with various cellular activities (AAA) domain-containing protein [Sarocladium implicatum]|nr:ATPase family associated with various cellular activities (AAA) domain-containing protein [Sarocladium implicatum]
MAIRSPLARDIDVCMRKLEERDGTTFKTIGTAYDAIRKSNSSLARRKKRQLEDAIEEVLRFRKKEEQDDDSEADIDIEDFPPSRPADDRFLLNRQMTKLWRDEPEEPATKTTTADETEPSAKKRKLDGSGSKSKEAKENGTTATDKKKVPKTPRFNIQSFTEGPQLGGVGAVLERLRERTLLMDKRIPSDLHKGPQTTGMLLSGPPGIGKRSLAQKLAATLDVPLIAIEDCFDDPERLEKSLTEAFDEALRLAPSFLFLENLDRLVPKSASSSSGGDSNKAAKKLTQQMRRISKQQDHMKPVKVIATTSAISDVEPMMLQVGLFNHIEHLKVPDIKAREEILKVLTADLPMDDLFTLEELSRKTHGFVAADMLKLITDVCEQVSWRASEPFRLQDAASDSSMEDSIPDDYPRPKIAMSDFEHVLTTFVPSLRQEGFTSIPSVMWDQVGALTNVRQKLHTSIIGPIKDPEFYRSYGLSPSAGVLLWGPPGCGKTLVAQAVANEAQASFILVKGPELLNKYVGESERGVRDLFERARSSTPCILFFDEIDALVPSRDAKGTEASNRVVNALLTELDGVGDRSGIFVIGTTNRPGMIDEAMLRPGRLSERLLVDLPTEDERVDIIRAIYRTKHSEASEAELAALEGIARDKRCKNFSGADLSGLHISAAKHAVERHVLGLANAAPGAGGLAGSIGAEGRGKILEEDWEYALANTVASVPRPELYRKM